MDIMKIRFYNARLLKLDGSMDVINDAEVWTEDSRITYAGASDDVSEQLRNQTRWDRQIDACSNLIMPGFKDAHTHSAMTFLRSRADDLKLDEWLHKTVFPMEATLKPQDIYKCTRLAILEYLSGGITSIFDMYMFPEYIAQATEEMGMRCVICGGMNDFSQSIEEQEKWYRSLNSGNPLTSYMVGIHAEYTCSKSLLEKTADLVRRTGSRLAFHCSETRSEVEQCKSRYWMTPLEFLSSLGLLNNGGAAFHCVHVNERDVQILREKNVFVVTNPASNAKLASGIAPLTTYLKTGIPVAIGTDGAASNNCLDMFREMFLATALGKLRENDASAVDANEVLKMAAVNGALAMGLNECDCLSVGKKADLIMLDLHQPNMRPINNITKNIVYSGSRCNVALTMIDGRILYEKGEFESSVDKEKIFAEAQQVIDSRTQV